MFSAITGSLPNQPASAFTTARPQPGGVGDNLVSRVEEARKRAMQDQLRWSLDSMDGFFYFESEHTQSTVALGSTSTSVERVESRDERRNSPAELEDDEFQSTTGACSPLLEEEDKPGPKSKRIMDYMNDNDLPSVVYLLEYADEEVKKLLKKNTAFMDYVTANSSLQVYFR